MISQKMMYPCDFYDCEDTEKENEMINNKSYPSGFFEYLGNKTADKLQVTMQSADGHGWSFVINRKEYEMFDDVIEQKIRENKFERYNYQVKHIEPFKG